MMQDPQFDSLPFSWKASLLGINRRSYFKCLQRPPPDPEMVQKEMRLRDEIQKIVIEFLGYGYRRITVGLHNRG